MKEGRFLLPGNDRRPADVLVPHWVGGKDAALDITVVEESFGGWHPGAQREVKKLGVALARHTGQEEAEAITHLWGRLGILLQRGNAAILGNCVPALPEAHIDGVL